MADRQDRRLAPSRVGCPGPAGGRRRLRHARAAAASSRRASGQGPARNRFESFSYPARDGDVRHRGAKLIPEGAGLVDKQRSPRPPSAREFLGHIGRRRQWRVRGGVLVGWSKAGTRPEFKIVTGISTGALIAPFAFLGPKYDPVLEATYTHVSQRDIFKPRNIIKGLLRRCDDRRHAVLSARGKTC